VLAWLINKIDSFVKGRITADNSLSVISAMSGLFSISGVAYLKIIRSEGDVISKCLAHLFYQRKRGITPRLRNGFLSLYQYKIDIKPTRSQSYCKIVVYNV